MLPRSNKFTWINPLLIYASIQTTLIPFWNRTSHSRVEESTPKPYLFFKFELYLIICLNIIRLGNLFKPSTNLPFALLFIYCVYNCMKRNRHILNIFNTQFFRQYRIRVRKYTLSLVISGFLQLTVYFEETQTVYTILDSRF